MYSLKGYGEMITDSGRMQAYSEALHRAIKPGAVVLDIGTGPGIMALLACQFGASRVYAVEPDEVINLAREIASANGYADRIEFFQGLSTQLELPQPANVVVSDLRGVLPLFTSHLNTIVDARQRLLDHDGVLIPQSDRLWAVPVAAPEIYQSYNSPWGNNLYDLNLKAGRRYLLNSWRKARLQPDQFLAEPVNWAMLDYTTIESPKVRAEMAWTVTQPGTGHGLGVWFDTTLFEEIGFSNAPGQPELIYGQAFFPWLEPVSLNVEDVIKVTLQATPTPDGDYLWAWNTKILAQGNPGSLKASFQQSNFFSTPLSVAQLGKQAAHYVPSLNEAGKVARFTLELLEQGLPLAEIAEHLAARFPQKFASSELALSRVGELSRLYSE